MEQASRNEVINRLRNQILGMQNPKNISLNKQPLPGLDLLANSFPGKIFPLLGIHEFISESKEQTAASSGFISGILSSLMKEGSPSIWISSSRKFFPPAAKKFSIKPESIIFVDLQNEKELLWVTEEALKCEGLAAVIVEIPELTFAASRRLQLVIEKSKVTALFLRENPKYLNNTTCLARWKITPLPSTLPPGMPGVGDPCWNVELLKVKNGQGNSFQLIWSGTNFSSLKKETAPISIIQTLQAG